MKKILFFVLITFSVTAHSQSVSKSWVDNEAKLANPAFQSANAQYYVNNVLCNTSELDLALKNWSPNYVTSVTVADQSPLIEAYPFSNQSIWIVMITGYPDPTFKRLAGNNNTSRKTKKKKACNND